MVKALVDGAMDSVAMLREHVLNADPKNAELRAAFREITHRLEMALNQPTVPLSEHREICRWLSQFLDDGYGTRIRHLENTDEQNRNEIELHIHARQKFLAMAEQGLPLIQAALHQCYSLLGQTPKAVDTQNQARALTGHLQKHLNDDECLREDLKALITAMKETLEEVTKILSDLAAESPELAQTAALLQQELPNDPKAARAILQSAQEGIIKAGQQISVAGNTLRKTMEQQTQQLHELTENLNQAKDQALHDALTGLANRRKLDVHIADLPDIAVTFLMLDIDHFKCINDRHGHHAGDEILAGLANILTANVRATDVVARMGGEEFSIVLPGVSGRKAYDMAESLRRAVEIGGLKCHAGKIPVTVSIGVAVRRAGEETGQWIKRADEALYKAKEFGRNCTKVSTD
jgi:diguanylate cyclase (GGDEF)-like protein